SGVLGAYALLHPQRPVTVLVIRLLVQMPAWMVVGLWFAFQLINSLGALGEGSQSGGVAYGAHIGGFLAGVALTFLVAPRR
ncbi:MAG TPA: rhomboid family intramembrane serine protease, partial [Gemmataceae bacterium]